MTAAVMRRGDKSTMTQSESILCCGPARLNDLQCTICGFSRSSHHCRWVVISRLFAMMRLRLHPVPMFRLTKPRRVARENSSRSASLNFANSRKYDDEEPNDDARRCLFSLLDASEEDPLPGGRCGSCSRAILRNPPSSRPVFLRVFLAAPKT